MAITAEALDAAQQNPNYPSSPAFNFAAHKHCLFVILFASITLTFVCYIELISPHDHNWKNEFLASTRATLLDNNLVDHSERKGCII
jgi:hypothetical protein